MPVTTSSPYAPTQIDTATTLQSAATGTGNGSALTVDPPVRDLTIAISGGVATLIPEWSFDGGANYVTASGAAIGAILTALASLTAAAGVAYYVFSVPPGANRFRTRISVFVSGNVTTTATGRR